MSFEKPLVVDWKGLKELGWPYSRTHTWRLMQPTIARSRGSRLKGTYVEWVEPNTNLFPACRKLGKHRGARVVWSFAEVLAYFEANGLRVNADWHAS